MYIWEIGVDTENCSVRIGTDTWKRIAGCSEVKGSSWFMGLVFMVLVV